MDQDRKRRWLHAPSPAMMVACVALFVALGGTSYAAIKLPANSVGTKQIKNSAVTGAKVKDATLTEAKIADGAVGTSKFGTVPGARVRHASTAVTVPSAATAVLSYDTTDFNIGGVFSAAQPTRLTAPVAGRYLISASVRWNPHANGRRTLAVELNGTVAQIARSNVSAYWATTANFSPEQTAETIYKLNAGDYVEVWAYQDSGGPLNLQYLVDNGMTFSMQWIAP
jgi:hypothetical protein